MAKDDDKAKKTRRIKKVETVREKAKKTSEPKKTRKLHRAKSAIKRPIVAAGNISKREYHVIKPRDSRLGRFLTKSRRWTPSFFLQAWREVRQVQWPNRRETVQLTFAVFAFSIGLGLVVYGIDSVLSRVFREVILG